MARKIGAEVETQVFAPIALRERPRKILSGVEQRLLIAQLSAPVVELAFALARFQPAALPDGVVGVLQRQLRQTRLAAFAVRLIAMHEFLNHHVHRPAIRHDVVHAHHQHLFVIGKTEQVNAQQWAGAQVERLSGDGRDL
ncbi:LysR family transcriptional regulator [Pseudomonas floridensis]